MAESSFKRLSAKSKAWLDEYYPVPAEEVPIEAALAHSLKKWEGVLDLERFDLEQFGTIIREKRTTSVRQRVLELYCDTCALCRHYRSEAGVCSGCPIVRVQDGIHLRCDQRIQEGFVTSEGSPYAKAIESVEASDPTAMLSLLRAATACKQLASSEEKSCDQ